jgi:ABC-type Mn2+/Zn2+ transport system ATPase subunit
MLLRVRDRDGVTVLMVSHDLGQARRIADRVTVLDVAVLGDGSASDTLADGFSFGSRPGWLGRS